MNTNLDKRYQTLIVLWFALLMSVGLYFALALLVAPAAVSERSNPTRSLWIVALTALGTVLVIMVSELD